jgi:hypothetical protein
VTKKKSFLIFPPGGVSIDTFAATVTAKVLADWAPPEKIGNLVESVNDKSYSGVVITTLHFLQNGTNKLECLFLASLSSLVQ